MFDKEDKYIPPAERLDRSTILPTEQEAQIIGPYQMHRRVLGGQTFSNVWIKDWIKSRGFKPKQSGFHLDAKTGIIECNRIYTKDLVVSSRMMVVDVGDDIQRAVDTIAEAGGGTVLLKNGTHQVSKDITLYSNINLQGESFVNCLLDFGVNFTGGGDTGIKFVGTNVYTTGTVTINNSDQTVVGTGTTWTSAMVDRYIFLDGEWYLISGFTDTTHLDISSFYRGKDLSGADYIISDINISSSIINLLLMAPLTSSALIRARYFDTLFLENIYFLGTDRAIDIDDGNHVFINTIEGYICDISALELGNVHYSKISNIRPSNTTLDVVSISACSRIGLDNCYVFDCATAEGIDITACDKISFLNVHSLNNATDGFKLSLNNTDITFNVCVAKDNLEEGFSLANNDDYCKLLGCISRDNGFYGINIENANCLNNIIANCTTNGNTSGTINDLGTGTVLDNNVT